MFFCVGNLLHVHNFGCSLYKASLKTIVQRSTINLSSLVYMIGVLVGFEY